ncbi:hypothetical protein [Planomonospora sp. ID82291]|uniref:hypothetical protein n=1 Tax=Planomonospora sp. ID82291 TaxID=2738136 RepID=UPI0018C44956|nr:hypothetical protein [Planomonospora sp. ID82291]MBG0818427.1 hypothetical protein [Planomonospora sp. ID82291]
MTPARPLAAGDTVYIHSLKGGFIDGRKGQWIIGRTGTVTAVLAGGQHAEVAVDTTGPPSVTGRQSTWTLAVSGLELITAGASGRKPRLGDCARVERIFLSHGDLYALRTYLVGQCGKIVALRGGTHALVELEESVPAPGGRAHRFTFHLEDLAITPAAPEPARPPEYGTALTGDRLRHAAGLPLRHRNGPVTAACGTRANLILIGEWSPPFDPDLERTCPACATAINRQERSLTSAA